MAVRVCTPTYDGPFDVLLQLVSEHKVDVYDVPLAPIVDGFLAHLAEREGLDLEEATEFLLVAAILVELKSKTLLPGRERIDDDEELGRYEERDQLIARLLELQVYAGAADLFAVLIERASRSVARLAGIEEAFKDLAPDLLAGVTPAQLSQAFAKACASAPEPPDVDLAHVTVEAVTVSEAVAELVERLPGEGRCSFRAITAHCFTRMQVIVRFLALLELCKQGHVSLEQGETFGELEVAWLGRPEGPPDAVYLVGAAGGGVEEYDG